MKYFSRKLVAILVLIIWLSSLGTKSILVESQSLGQNGYLKCSNGLLIQWGYARDSQNSNYNQSVYLSVSFADNVYVVCTTAYSNYQQYYVGRTIDGLHESYFVVSANQQNHESFYWIAIGRWK